MYNNQLTRDFVPVTFDGGQAMLPNEETATPFLPAMERM